MKKPHLTVAVPTHDMPNKVYFLRRLFDSLWNQSFQDFEIVVTDNSEDYDLEEVCEWYRTGIRYIRNPRKGMAQNTNEAIKQSKGDLIKILYMDDYLAHDNSLRNIVNKFKGQWMVSGCKHSFDGNKVFNTHWPEYSNDLRTGNNTIGSPSVLTIKNKDPLMFDEEMTWLLDCDYYHRLYEKHGKPTILEDVNVIIGLGAHQATNILSDELKVNEQTYLTQKYA